MTTIYKNKSLPEFQEYLRSRALTLESRIPFFARWAQSYVTFLGQVGQAGIPFETSLDRFLKHISLGNGTQEWQVRQAEEAVRLYEAYRENNGAVCSVPAEATAPVIGADIKGKLKEAMRLQHYAYSTERTYLDWAKRFGDYAGRVLGKASHGDWTSEDVRDYLSRLAVVDRVSASTQNQAFNAILFLFRSVLGKELGDIQKTVRAKRGVRLPVVLSKDEVRQTFQAMEGESRLMLELLYGTGMRLMELARLRVQDVDFANGTLYVRAGKGDKDRATMLPKSVQERLVQHLAGVKKRHSEDLAKGFGEVYLPDALERKYLNAAKEWRWQYVFPSDRLSVDPRSGKVRRHHISDTAIQKTMERAVKRAGLTKHATVHTLRHSFATHLLMKGVNIREVQDLLGHKNVQTTMIYTHVMRNLSTAPQSPLDDLVDAGSPAVSPN